MASNTFNAPETHDGEINRQSTAAQPMRGRAPMGQSSLSSAPNSRELVQETQVVTPRDRVRWGPIWAGLLTTFTSFLLLELLAYGLGLLTNNGTNGTGASGASPWVTGIIGLIAFFLGGYIAERTSAVRGNGAGMLNGFMVWALATTLIFALSVLGLSTLFGALGNVAGQFVAAGRSVNPGNVNVNPADIAAATRNAAWGAFFSLLLAAIAAAAGGMLGGQGRPLGQFRRTR